MDVWSFGVSEGLRDRTALVTEVHTPSAHLQKAQINSVVCLYVVDWSHCRTGPYNFLGKGGDLGGLKREHLTCQHNFYV